MSAFRSGASAWRRWSGQALEDRDPQRDRLEGRLIIVAIAFIFVNAIAFSLVRESAVTWPHIYAPVVWLVVIVICHLTLRAARPLRDPYLLPTFALLTGWGLLLQDRLAPNFLGRQTLWFSLATVAMMAVAIFPRSLHALMRYRYVLAMGGLILLAITLAFGVNPSGSGAALWLPVPFPYWGVIYFQPSELLKLLLVIFLASYFTEQEPVYHYRQERRRERPPGKWGPVGAILQHLPFLGPLLLMWGFTMLLLVWQQDLGATALFFIVFVALVYLATGQLAYVWSGIVLLILAGVIAFFAFDTVVAPRVLSWLNPWPNVSDRAYQIVQALYAQAAGGILGQGIGQGFPDYIPVVHSDFALAAVAEEWGLVGSLTIVALFALLAMRGLRSALLAIRGRRPNFFHAYLAAGLITMFSVQAFLIMGGVTRLLPLTGITLPFVSYGGSSLLVSCLAIGLLIYLSAAAEPPPPTPPADPGLARRIRQLGLVLLAVFSIVALTLTFWVTIRSDTLLAREDNPRLIEAERRVQRGRILDRNEVVLAQTIGPADTLARVYPLTEAGPAVGYYSLRFGTAGAENAYDTHLRGQDSEPLEEAIRTLLHEPVAGGDIRLTLDAELQRMATTLMIERGASGGLVLLELVEIGGEPVGEIRALVSLPNYDPNQIDSQFETLTADDPGPLFDRAAQGLYQPGMILQSFIVAAAVDDGILRLDDILSEPFVPVTLGDQVQRCVEPRVEGDTAVYAWSDMARLRCPGPLKVLGEELGAGRLDDILSVFGLHTAPDLSIPTTGSAVAVGSPGLAAIGQENLTVTPLQAALATAALADDGRLPSLRLVEAVAEDGGEWELQPGGTSGSTMPIVSAETAAAVRATWPAAGSVRDFAITVLSGPGGSRNSWFLGMAPATEPRYVVALVLEEEEDMATGEAIGRALLNAANNQR